MGGIRLEKPAENMLHGFLRDTGAVVSDPEQDSVVTLLQANLNKALRRAEFHSVCQQIAPYMAQKGFVAKVPDGVHLYVQLDILSGPVRFQCNDRLPDLFVQ